ncbi:class I SAM-dependent methyltransferase [Paenibacillus flagellatus]|uniref:SAM-dependent methyltransferase n=1 Tax=Paenibacillus flagellatus TaxID=2211139 RepID=A0A2V5K5J4_9BACL|nr:methyltransferase domain-containing protein [Paenibacillus flagellatus]PYI54631.1 SAM-dependent methyltransferase [Paenibacillus flagellatus]
MKEREYRSFYDRVGLLNGWNFSRLQVSVTGETWDYAEEVKNRCVKTDIVLDLGTGGGERILPLADEVMLVIGIDRSAGMIATAERNAVESGKRNVRFHRMEAERLTFPDGFFDVVCARHAPFDAREAARVLKKGGRLVTQQVGEADKANVKRAFGRGQHDGVEDGSGMREYIARLEEAGFTRIDAREYDAVETYRTVEDLIFLLKHTPIVPDFGRTDDDFRRLDAFVREFGGPDGIRTNAKRYFIAAVKEA